MISLQALQVSFNPTKHGLVFHSKGPSDKKNHFPMVIITLCKSKGSGSEDPPQGDTRKQELLARIAMLQTSKVRLTDYLDERSAYLTRFAEEANAEFDQIGEEALRGLDEASSRIMDSIESRMQAFEESADTSKIEMEQSEKQLSDFEGQIEKDRNEGLFFKSLGKNSTEKGQEKVDKQLTIDGAGSKTRRNIYLTMIVLLVTGIADSLISSLSGWQKPAILAVILVGVVSQLIYEQMVMSETERTENGKSKREKK